MGTPDRKIEDGDGGGIGGLPKALDYHMEQTQILANSLNGNGSAMIILHDGTIAQTPIVIVVMSSLETLIKENPIAFYELVMQSRDASHDLFGRTGEYLGKLGLLGDDGKVQRDVALVVQNAVQGEGIELTLQSPIKKVKNTEDGGLPDTQNNGFEFSDQEHFTVLKEIEALILEELGRDSNTWFESIHNEGPNPYYNQTRQGFFLELYYGTPNRLWTPWGQYRIFGSSSGIDATITESIVGKLGGKIHQRLVKNSMGEYGPIYSINSINGKLLPVPEVRKHGEFITHEDITKIWTSLQNL